MKLKDLSIKEFLEKTASGTPVPGGGSNAALCAAMAASLTEMVANMTIGKKGYEANEEEMKDIAKDASDYRNNLVKDIDMDLDAYNDILAAYKLSKSTEHEKKIRKQAVQDAFKTASLVPLDVAKKALKVIELAQQVINHGNKNAISDGEVAVMIARAAIISELYNIKINLSSINDVEFVERIRKDVTSLEIEIDKKQRKILSGLSI